jgi:glutamyl-tRNA synthetase
MRKLPPTDLANRAIPFIVKDGLFPDEASARVQQSKIEASVAMEQEKVKLLPDVSKRIDIFFKDVQYDQESVDKVLKKPDVPAVLEDAVKVFSELPQFTAAATEQACKDLAAKRGVKNGAIYHPVRVSVSGRTQGPSLFHMLELLGKEESISRIKKTAAKFFSAA